MRIPMAPAIGRESSALFNRYTRLEALRVISLTRVVYMYSGAFASSDVVYSRISAGKGLLALSINYGT